MHPSPLASIVDLIEIRLVMVVLVSVESVCVGPTSPIASVSLKLPDAWTTGIPAFIAESKAAASDRMVDGTGGVAVIAALRART